MFGAIGYEQAVYGSFPFWSRGYAVLAASADSPPGRIDAMKRACARFGEPPPGVAAFRSVFALPIDRSTWMIVQAASLGRDDQGRPGALAFHALFVSSWSYRKAGGCPLAFAPAFRADWSAADQDSPLPPGRLKPAPLGRADDDPADDRVAAIVAALARGRRVVVQSPEPAAALLRSVWRRLPGRARRRAKAASWAFGNANGFDFLATPKLGALVLDGGELII